MEPSEAGVRPKLVQSSTEAATTPAAMLARLRYNTLEEVIPLL